MGHNKKLENMRQRAMRLFAKQSKRNMRKLGIIVSLFVFSLTIHGHILPKDKHLTVNQGLQKLANKLLEGKQGSIVAIEPTVSDPTASHLHLGRAH